MNQNIRKFVVTAVLPITCSLALPALGGNLFEGSSCADNGSCNAWVMTENSCSPKSTQFATKLAAETSSSVRPKLLPTDRPFKLHLDIVVPNVVRKSISLPDCADGAALLEFYYETSVNRSVRPRGLEFGRINSMKLISARVFYDRFVACDPALYDRIAEQVAIGGLLEKEAARNYSYRATETEMVLYFNDGEICKTPGADVKLTFERNSEYENQTKPIDPNASPLEFLPEGMLLPPDLNTQP